MVADVDEFYQDFIDDENVIDVPEGAPVVAKRKEECSERPENTEVVVPSANYVALGVLLGLVLAAIIVVI